MLQYGRQTKCDKWDIFDGAVFAKHGRTKLTDRYNDLLIALNQVRKGGPFIIVPEVYEQLPYGAVGAETLLCIMGFDMMISPSEGSGIIYGIKR